MGVILVVAASVVTGFVTVHFPGWSAMPEISPSIVIVRCTSSGVQRWVSNGVVNVMWDGIVRSDVELVSVLKGESMPPGTKGTLYSQHWGDQGKLYLVYASYYDGSRCDAFDDYRVVPLGHNCPTNMLDGKSLDEQIKVLLKYRLDSLNRELEHGQVEKKRLEEAFAPASPPRAIQK